MCAAKRKDRKLTIYDVFGVIPAPSERDEQDVHDRYDVIRRGKSEGIRGDLYYGYVENLLERVLARIPTLVSILLTIGWPRTPLFMRVGKHSRR